MSTEHIDMKTVIELPTPDSLAEAGRLIRAGALVGFATETVYGLGADAFNAQAVKKIFLAKNRPGDNPLIVHIAKYAQLDELVEGTLPDAATRLADAYWPGPMTIVLKKSNRVPDCVSPGMDTVGVRMPDHPLALALIESAGTPIAAPSANRSGRPSPTTAEHVLADMNGRIALILDGGACDVGLESTVIDVTCDPVRILRPGAITPEMVMDVLGAVEVDGSVLRPPVDGERVRSPGMKYKHYAPNGRLTIVSGAYAVDTINHLYDESEESGVSCCILSWDKNAHCYAPRRVKTLGADAKSAGAQLFAVLREMDALGMERIFSEAVLPQGFGLAVMNRLGRAAAFDEIDASNPIY